MSEKKNSFLLQGGVLALAGLITRFIGLIYRIPLTRVIGREGMGYYSTAYEIYNITLLISTYSIPVAVSKLVSSRNSKGEYRNSIRIFRIGMVFAGLVGLSFSAILFFFADQLATAMKWPSAAIPLRVLAPTIFVFAVMGIIRGFFQGRKNMVPTAISQIIEQIFNAVFSVVAAVLLMRAFADNIHTAAYGAAGGTTGTLTGALFGLLFLVVFYLINRKVFRAEAASDTTGARESTGFIIKAIFLTMLPIVLSQTIYQISGITDNYMFSELMYGKGMDESTKSVIWEAYSNKYKLLSNVPVAIASAFGVSIVPTLSAAVHTDSNELIKSKIASSVKLNMIIAFPCAAGLGFLAGPILFLLFGQADDVLSPQLMSLGCIAVVFFALSTLTNGILQGLDHMQLPVIHSAISLAVHIPLVLLMVGVFNMGIYGMVIGNVTYALLVCILNWRSIHKLLDYRQEIKTSFIIPCLASVCMGLLSWGLYLLLGLAGISPKLSTIIAIVFAIIIYFVLLLLFKGVSKEELSDFPKGALLVKIAGKLKLL